MVLCQLKDCPKPECDEPIRIRDDCCPVCPGISSIYYEFFKLNTKINFV